MCALTVQGILVLDNTYYTKMYGELETQISCTEGFTTLTFFQHTVFEQVAPSVSGTF